MRFEWDEDKNRQNIAKHGIDFADAQYVFADSHYIDIYDVDHSDDEDRWWVIGNIGYLAVVVVTYREGDIVRIISARRAERKERRLYYG
ncbi:MAG: BrnT family toxin [Spirochaetaceae bacterium]|jgi:uncharacterized DUF497 family protein|nr:BrnT family toxin [Spirochaetaceae bacterium]